jgi:hypothetical protein
VRWEEVPPQLAILDHDADGGVEDDFVHVHPVHATWSNLFFQEDRGFFHLAPILASVTFTLRFMVLVLALVLMACAPRLRFSSRSATEFLYLTLPLDRLIMASFPYLPPLGRLLM